MDVKDIIELANIIAERPCDSEDCAPCIRMGRRCNDYLKAERAIKAGFRKWSEWISVEERLPEPYTWVMVYNPNGKYTKIDTDEIVGGNWVRNCGKVTNWMPLPEPPKGA